MLRRRSFVEPFERCRKRRKLVVVQVEEVGEGFEIAYLFRKPAQLVVAEVEHAELFQAADLPGDFCEAVVSENQRFETCLLPYRGRHISETLLP